MMYDFFLKVPHAEVWAKTSKRRLRFRWRAVKMVLPAVSQEDESRIYLQLVNTRADLTFPLNGWN